jgi:outer membrane protein assembly factor BamD (BamD/ComL family)
MVIMQNVSRKQYSTLIVLVALALILCACAGSAKHFTPALGNVQMAEADSLFSCGNYEEAKTTYEKVRTAMPPFSANAEKAHYYAAYIDVFYKNPHGDWNAALTEFKSFAALYPNDPHINDVLSWIRILTTIKLFETEYRRTTNKVDRLTQDKTEASEINRLSLDSMGTILHRSYESLDSVEKTRDSLSRKNDELIKTIIDLEKKCQQAGK